MRSIEDLSKEELIQKVRNLEDINLHMYQQLMHLEKQLKQYEESEKARRVMQL